LDRIKLPTESSYLFTYARDKPIMGAVRQEFALIATTTPINNPIS
jgi:hypothetical protein